MLEQKSIDNALLYSIIHSRFCFFVSMMTENNRLKIQHYQLFFRVKQWQ